MFQHKISPALIKGNNLFEGVNESDIKNSFVPQNLLEIKEGDIVYQKGDKTDSIFLIIDGEVKIKLPGTASYPLIEKKNKNEFFGEKELIERTDRKSSSVAMTGLYIYKMEKEVLMRLIKSNGLIRKNLYQYRIITDKKEEDFLEDSLLEDEEQIEESVIEPEKTQQFQNLSTEEYFGLSSEELNKDIQPSEEESKENERMSGEVLNDNESNEQTADISWSLPEAPLIENQNLNNSDFSEGKNMEDYLNDFNELPEETKKIDFIQPNQAEKLNSEKFFRLLQAVELFHEAYSLEDALLIINKSLKDLTSASFCRVMVKDREDEKFLWSVDSNLFTNTKIEVPVENTLSGKSFLENEIINKNNPDPNEIEHEKIGSAVSSLLYFPISISSGEILGVIELFNSDNNKFSETDEEILSLLSLSITKALNRESAEPVQSTAPDVNHEYKNVNKFLLNNLSIPLNSIMEYTYLLRDQNAAFSPLVNGMNNLSVFSMNLIETVNEFIDKGINISPESISLNETLNNFLPLFAEYADKKNVKILKKIEDDVFIKLDKNKFYQACFQIIKNSCEALPDGGTIHISTKNNDGEIFIEFKDNGNGMSANVLQEILEPYSSSIKQEKAGLGLAIAKQIVEKHNGNISAESEPGEGTSIKITLPV